MDGRGNLQAVYGILRYTWFELEIPHSPNAFGINEVCRQPRSQGLSSLPPWVVERKTLVAAGHVTTQNLGGKKICWLGRVAEYFVWLMRQTLWVSNPVTVANKYTLYRGSKSNLPMKNASRFLPSSELKTFVHKEIRRPNGAETF